jgi:5-methylcytosine-specific restriction endonuclease McrA
MDGFVHHTRRRISTPFFKRSKITECRIRGDVVIPATLLSAGLVSKRRKTVDDLHKAYRARFEAGLLQATARDDSIIMEVESARDDYCVRYDGYPPDWNYRVKMVLERDHHRCTECGWPGKIKRKVRQLHAHHIKRHSQGGDHRLSNLATLCDICHRKQEGVGHNRINPRRRTKGTK